MDAEKLAYLKTLVQFPEETSTAEYKSGVAFEPKNEFGAKLIKHILGQANAGGGYIVLGLREGTSGKLEPDLTTDPTVSKSYETTKLSQCVDKYLADGQRIEPVVHKAEVNAITFPVISIQGFSDIPFFCSRDFNGSDGKS